MVGNTVFVHSVETYLRDEGDYRYEVEADIHAQNVTVSGRFRGNIVAQGRAELTRGGRVDGNVTAKALVVAEGAVFNGQSNMDPAKAQRDRSASSADGDGSAAPAEVSAPAK